MSKEDDGFNSSSKIEEGEFSEDEDIDRLCDYRGGVKEGKDPRREVVSNFCPYRIYF